MHVDGAVNTRAAMGARLKLERERLGYSQQALADACGVPKRTLQDWEAGIRSVGSEFLGSAAGMGVDVFYILTGHRQQARYEEPSAAQRARLLEEGIDWTSTEVRISPVGLRYMLQLRAEDGDGADLVWGAELIKTLAAFRPVKSKLGLWLHPIEQRSWGDEPERACLLVYPEASPPPKPWVIAASAGLIDHYPLDVMDHSLPMVVPPSPDAPPPVLVLPGPCFQTLREGRVVGIETHNHC